MADTDQLCGYFASACALAVAKQEGLIVAVEDAVGEGRRQVADVFLKVDALSAYAPEAVFRNEELATLAEGAPLTTEGEVGADATDCDSWAFRCGYARDRVIGAARLKASTLSAHALGATPAARQRLETLPARVLTEMRQCEREVAESDAAERQDPLAVHAAKRAHWQSAARTAPVFLRQQPTLCQPCLVTGYTRAEIDAIAADPKMETDAPFDAGKAALASAAARDAKIGTEWFVSLVFAPDDHAELHAANATGGGVRTSSTYRAFPAYVTVHNCKGAVKDLPEKEGETKPNSFIVSDAASLLYDLHSLASAADRNYLLLQHELKL